MPFMLALVPAAMAAGTIASAGGIAAMTTTALAGTLASAALGTVGAVGSVMSSNEQRAEGKAAEQSADYTAAIDTQNAGQTQASSQRAAIAQDKNTALVESNAVSAAVGQGGTSTDPTVVNDMSLIKTEGDYRAANQMYEGNSKAQALRNEAADSIYQGGVAQNAANTKANTTLINGASSLFSKYGAPFLAGGKNASDGNPASGYTDENGIQWGAYG